ncbi:MAG: 50S ribosomal protein L2 [Candidatus Woesearchaeota archaeon]
MGKRIITQRRGKGSTTYRAHSFNFKGEATHPIMHEQVVEGVVVDLVHCAAHTAPLARVAYEHGDEVLLIAPEGVRIGDALQAGSGAVVKEGNVLFLQDIPEGTLIYNIEAKPGDGGKFVRASGTYARIVGKTPAGVVLRLPSKKQKVFNGQCRAAIGVVAGGGRTEKPLLKAGVAHYKHKARNHLYPRVSGSAMNAVDHPFGNKRTSRKSKARPISGNAPPGRKVGMVAAKRTGRKKK